MDMDASVPMLRMYWRCTGETLRRAAKLKSSGAAVVIERWLDRHGRVVRIGDHAQPVESIQLARLCRNVGRGKALARVGGQYAVAVFGQHFAVPLRVETIDQDAVEAADLPELARGRRAQLEDIFVGRQIFHEAADARVISFERLAFAGGRLLELENGPLSRLMAEHLQALAVDIQCS